MARSIPGASRTLTGLTSILSDGAATCMTPNWAGPVGTAGSLRTATRVTFGAISFKSSSHFAAIPNSLTMNPVALPPGRARLSTKPAATGSLTIGNTTGMIRVACNNGPIVEAPCARMTSGASATNSAACLRISSAWLVAQRVSIRALRPMLQPSSASPCRNAPMRTWNSGRSEDPGRSTPMRRGGSPCCARAASGHAAAAPPSSVMNCATLRFDHLVGKGKERVRNFQTQRPGGLGVNDEVEFGGLLDREVARFSAAKNLVDIVGGAPETVRQVRSVGHQTGRLHVFPKPMHSSAAAHPAPRR